MLKATYHVDIFGLYFSKALVISLGSVWHETEMAVIYLTAILSAVILDVVMRPQAQKKDLTSESFTLCGSNTGSWNPPVINEFCIEKELMQACLESTRILSWEK